MSADGVDVSGLAAALAARLRCGTVELRPLSVECAWPVFRASVPGREPVFVKLAGAEAAGRTLAFLRTAGPLRFLPQPVLAEPFAFGGFFVLCLEWKAVERVDAEAMTDAQAESFAQGCMRLSEALVRFDGPVSELGEDAPEAQHAQISAYAARHPLAARLVRPLVEMPLVERSYAGRALVVIHGDLQPRNYGFAGESLAAVFDFDDLTRGLACEDAAYAFTERARRAGLSAAKRTRLTELFLRFALASPWPVEDWLLAVGHARLRIAARRLASHPDSLCVAFDIARRDRPLRALAEALKGLHA